MNRTLERILIVVLAIGFITTLAHDLREHNPSATDANAKEQGIDEAELMNDEYYRARIDLIREHIESFICGDIENGVLEPYKAIVQRDFRIVDMHGVMGGGIYFRFVFPNHPNDVFQVFTSIDVDDETDSITAYHLGEFKKIDNCTD